MHPHARAALAASLLALAACHSQDAESSAQEDAGEAIPATTVVMGFPPGEAPKPDPQRCEAARKAIESFVAKLPADCDKDQDCGGYYLHDDVCAGPTMLRQPGCPPGLKPRLFAMQHAKRLACAPGPACEPKPFKAVCVEHRCADALADAGAPPKAAARRDAGR